MFSGGYPDSNEACGLTKTPCYLSSHTVDILVLIVLIVRNNAGSEETRVIVYFEF